MAMDTDTIIKMHKKDISFGALIVVLCSIIGILTGYYQLQLRNEKKQLEKKQEETPVVSQDTNQTPDNGKIICIGDSLTLGLEGQQSYPELLASMTNKPVITFGGGEDTSLDVAARLGSYELYTNTIVIPSTGSVSLHIYDKNMARITPFTGVGNSINPVTISGVSGELTYDIATATYTFTRNATGDEVAIEELTPINVAPFTVDPEKDILVIFSGTYDSYYQGSIYDTISNQFKIARHFNTERYIVISLTAKQRFEEIDELNELIKENHGEEHYLDIRTYLLENGLTEAGLVATQQDEINISYGYIPTSLVVDSTNGTTQFNQILANQVAQKLLASGYLTQEDIKGD